MITTEQIINAHLEYYCQPIYDSVSGRCTKCEVLLRAFDGEGNAYPIEEFILAAEQTDVISIIDLQVIIHTMQELPAYVELGIVQAGVNISPISCKYREFRKSVESLLEEHRSLCPI